MESSQSYILAKFKAEKSQKKPCGRKVKKPTGFFFKQNRQL